MALVLLEDTYDIQWQYCTACCRVRKTHFNVWRDWKKHDPKKDVSLTEMEKVTCPTCVLAQKEEKKMSDGKAPENGKRKKQVAVK